MVVLIVVVVLLFAIISFRIVGMGTFLSNTLKSEGRMLQARLRLAYSWSIVGGLAITLIGDFTNQSILRIAGVICIACACPIMFAQLFLSRKRLRDRSK